MKTEHIIFIIICFLLLVLLIGLLAKVISQNKIKSRNWYNFDSSDNQIKLGICAKDLNKFDITNIKSMGDDSYTAWISVFSLKYIMKQLLNERKFKKEFCNLLNLEIYSNEHESKEEVLFGSIIDKNIFFKVLNQIINDTIFLGKALQKDKTNVKSSKSIINEEYFSKDLLEELKNSFPLDFSDKKFSSKGRKLLKICDEQLKESLNDSKVIKYSKPTPSSDMITKLGKILAAFSRHYAYYLITKLKNNTNEDNCPTFFITFFD